MVIYLKANNYFSTSCENIDTLLIAQFNSNFSRTKSSFSYKLINARNKKSPIKAFVDKFEDNEEIYNNNKYFNPRPVC